jgi:glycosyltransferase involved in cell wall biosynthesis
VSRVVHVLVPEGIHDPRRPSGGNTYDRRLCQALAAHGRTVRVVEVPGGWPWTAEAGRGPLDAALAALGDRSLVVVDGLLASGLADVVVPAAARLRVVLLMHLPLGGDAEGAVVQGAAAVVTPSDWCRRWVLEAHGADPARVHVAQPGADTGPAAEGRPEGGRLLCVGSVTPAKGQDLLLAALSRIVGESWTCTCVGPDDLAPGFAVRLRREAGRAGIGGRFLLVGPRVDGALDAAYAASDVLVVASRLETYGMVVTEALARGLPVIAAAVGGVPEALGSLPDGSRAGILVRPGVPAALADAVRRWLSDGRLRHDLRAAALRRRAALAGWDDTAARVGRVLDEVAA